MAPVGDRTGVSQVAPCPLTGPRVRRCLSWGNGIGGLPNPFSVRPSFEGGPGIRASTAATQDSREEFLGHGPESQVLPAQPHHHLQEALPASARGRTSLSSKPLAVLSGALCATWVCPLYALPGAFSFHFSLTARPQGKDHIRFSPLSSACM
ncbi:hypothetical protein mRhiFer1_009307 [Rhinolophus ferrumequinum]|uniref:Uncharacterized protein n=1 Tax=Rhinolophus ferrumequinum TaxID=59479 RepID=A0A7J7RXQ9_RHIFE|nr:hypothetical protein mRhiFer1_009307 [Rhinolophus ferrumequinum]